MKPFFCAVGVVPYYLLYFVCRLAAWAAHCLFINPGERSTYATWTPKLDIGRWLLPAGQKAELQLAPVACIENGLLAQFYTTERVLLFQTVKKSLSSNHFVYLIIFFSSLTCYVASN